MEGEIKANEDNRKLQQKTQKRKQESGKKSLKRCSVFERSTAEQNAVYR